MTGRAAGDAAARPLATADGRDDAPRRRSRCASRPPGGSRPAPARPSCARSSRRRSPCSTPRRRRSPSTTRRPTGSSSGSRPASRARASSASRSRPTRASPATSSRPARRSPCRTSTSDARFGRRRRADRLRAALDRRRAARRRRGHDRRPRGPRQAQRGGVRPARHRARVGLRPPGGGRDPGEPRRARHGGAPRARRCRDRRTAATRPSTTAVAGRGRPDGDRRARPRGRQPACGRSSTQVARIRGAIPTQLELVADLLGVLADHAEREARAGDAADPARAPADGGPMTDDCLPAWSEPFAGDRRAALARPRRSRRRDRDWAFGGADGAGVTVAIIDSGVEGDHPAVGGKLRRERPGRARRRGGPSRRRRRRRSTSSATGPPAPGSSTGWRPGADIVSVRVLGPGQPGQGRGLRGRPRVGDRAGRGRRQPEPVVARARRCSRVFHDLADRAYFANVLLVCAANNVAGPSYPSLFAAVVSVAAHDVPDPWTWFYNPRRRSSSGPTGVDVDVAWTERRPDRRRPATASPRRTSPGYAALIRAKHPGAHPVRGQDDPGDRRERGRARAADPSRRGYSPRLDGLFSWP